MEKSKSNQNKGKEKTSKVKVVRHFVNGVELTREELIANYVTNNPTTDRLISDLNRKLGFDD